MVVEVVEEEKEEKTNWMVWLVKKNLSYDDGGDLFVV